VGSNGVGLGSAPKQQDFLNVSEPHKPGPGARTQDRDVRRALAASATGGADMPLQGRFGFDRIGPFEGQTILLKGG